MSAQRSKAFRILGFSLAVAATLAGLLAGPFWGRSAVAEETTLPAGEHCYSTCGGEIPWPFQVSNQALELADEERYVLMGTVDLMDGIPYFRVDLKTQPWLATAKRKKQPYYELIGTENYWSKYIGRTIQLRAIAHWFVVDGEDRSFETQIMLESLSDPAVEAIRPSMNTCK